MFFCEFYEISKTTFSGRTPPVAAFGIGVGYIIPKIIVYVETGYDFTKKCVKRLSWLFIIFNFFITFF